MARLWRRATGEEMFSCFQILTFGSGFALSAALTVLPATSALLLVCGTDENKINLYLEANNQFIPSHTLKGHEDWIRGLEFIHDDFDNILLASCSQDSSIRIWKISLYKSSEIENNSINSFSKDKEIKLKENIISTECKGKIFQYTVSLDSVLSGHEDWIYAVRWQRPQYKDGERHQPMKLLSASMDKTMILWAPDESTGVWLEEVRVGEVGGNTLGFYGCCFSPSGFSILAHSYQGSFHLWHWNEELKIWEPGVSASGHFDSVEDISWNSESSYLLSVSLDQTTRLHAPWVRAGKDIMWHEIARPQIHGYDIKCVTAISKYKFASGADEKVLRAFQAPKNFVENCASICKIDVGKDQENLPEGASVPALGLSNKAVYETGSTNLYSEDDLQPHPNEQYKELYFQPVVLATPPSEEHLLQNTLWPEVHKLYGHGFEIFCVASNYAGTLLASACKASKAEYAGIILWDTVSWQMIGQLSHHSLTVTQLAFSPDDEFLLSVSRDRTWCLFKKQTGELPYYRVAFSDKKTGIHSRIIWSCSWSHDSKYFITASRDKKVIIWDVYAESKSTASVLGSVRACSVPLELEDSVTAVDIAPVLTQDFRYIIAVGLDNGLIILYKWCNKKDQDEDCWSLGGSVSANFGHHLTINRLRFRQKIGMVCSVTNSNVIQLASGGADNSIRIFNIDLDLL